MEEQTNKPTKGTWDRLGEKDDTPKISFDVNIPQTMTFLMDTPEEKESTEGKEGEVYYKFSVMQDGVNKYFTSSAWTLLGALKGYVPLKNKAFTITKRLIKGKQSFEVVSIVNP